MAFPCCEAEGAADRRIDIVRGMSGLPEAANKVEAALIFH